MNETQEPALGAQVLPFDKGRWGHSTNQRTATALSGSAVKDKIACGRRESMEFLKPVLGDALYEQVQKKLEGQKDIKLANLALGQYVDKRKFKAKAAALEKAEERLQTLEQALKDSQARYVQTELICAAEGLLQKAMKCLQA